VQPGRRAHQNQLLISCMKVALPCAQAQARVTCLSCRRRCRASVHARAGAAPA